MMIRELMDMVIKDSLTWRSHVFLFAARVFPSCCLQYNRFVIVCIRTIVKSLMLLCVAQVEENIGSKPLLFDFAGSIDHKDGCWNQWWNRGISLFGLVFEPLE